ncbi:uncharacterized protein LOC106074251 isoform X2 [Biomphalaria glabrata]|uniref:Uncharacterized protein LOC106074251 isoform X2 n=1 Tax=Biomphalaria glabrata TaxID=6526 RepID=A0A9W2Z3T6_BIOGL|nr:uncharacterized protein LOC106074251 isoform X2 [Biomphalaria glabrata]
MAYEEEEEVILGQAEDIDVNTPAPTIPLEISLSDLGLKLKSRRPSIMVSQLTQPLRIGQGTSALIDANDHTAQSVVSSAAAPNKITLSSDLIDHVHSDQENKGASTIIQTNAAWTHFEETLNSGPSTGIQEVGYHDLDESSRNDSRLTNKYAENMAEKSIGTASEGATQAMEQKLLDSSEPQKKIRLCKCKRQIDISCVCGYINICKHCCASCPFCKFKATRTYPHT